MTLVGFRIRFPEFTTAGDTLVQACLDVAALETSAEQLGSSYDEAQGLLAAHKLACSPFGGMARLEKTNQTTYELERRAMLQRLLGPFAVGVYQA